MKSKGKIIRLIHAHTFFVDVVGLSDPVLPVKNQVKKIRMLNSLISSCKAFRDAKKSSRLILSTGDGMSINFLQGPELPFRLAIELHKKLNVYNKGKIPDEMLRIRIGMNEGPVYVVEDIEGNQSIWGPGVILARRVMDLGDAGHILLTSRMAESLRELSIEYRLMIKPLAWYNIKHDQVVLLYSVYSDGIGNPTKPTKFLFQDISPHDRDLIDQRHVMIDKEIDITLTVKDPKTMLTHHKHTYLVEVKSDEPIQTILHGITTDVPKSFNDLDIRITDESGKELKISGVNLETPYQKEFTIYVDKPFRKGEQGRGYTLEYDVEEPDRYCESFSQLIAIPVDYLSYIRLMPVLILLFMKLMWKRRKRKSQRSSL